MVSLNLNFANVNIPSQFTITMLTIPLPTYELVKPAGDKGLKSLRIYSKRSLVLALGKVDEIEWIVAGANFLLKLRC